FIAPFMLFGSEQSREGALRTFEDALNPTSSQTLYMLQYFSFLLCLALPVSIVFLFLRYWLGNEYRGFVLYFFMTLGYIVLLFRAYKMKLTGIYIIFIDIMVIAVGVLIAPLSEDLFVDLFGGLLEISFVQFALVFILGLGLGLVSAKATELRTGLIVLLYSATILLTLTLVYKVIYTIRYIRYGFTSFYSNWRKICWSQDIYFPPELLPGIENYEGLEYIKWSNILRDFGKIDTVLLTNKLVDIVIVFIPTYLYRISMKATFWFYFPLLLLAIPYKVGELKDKAFFEGIFKPILSWMVCLFALSIVVYSVPVIKDFLPASLLDMLSLEITPFLDKYFPIQFLFYPAVLFILIFLFSNLYSYIVTERTYNSWKRQTIVWGIRVLYALLIIAGFGIFSSLAAHIIPPDYPLIREPFIAIKEFLTTWYTW
ncbi:MAG: hypothetical protein QM536_02735, partial [Chitinophagaceae bacterium]|nr:hypothetical protein [Chitinophagaceae bacterium]